MKKCVIPGTFDPIHDGHFAIIKRALKIFDSVIVAVAKSAKKNPKHSFEQRINLAKDMCAEIPNVEVKGFECLLVDFVKNENADCVVKGLRNVKDFEYESNQVAINSKLSKDFETLFMISDAQLKEMSSTMIRELESFDINTNLL